MGYGNLANPNGAKGPARVQTTPAQMAETERITAANNRPVDTTPQDGLGFNADHSDARALMEQFLRQQQTAGRFQAPDVNAATAAGPGQISYDTPGAVERVNAGAIGQQTPVTAGEINQGGDVRSAQTGLIGSLQQQIAGHGPSVAEAQQARALDTIAAQQSGLAAQAHGNAGVFARREAMRNVAGAQQATSLDAAQIRAQEQLNAENALSGVTQSTRGQDISGSTAQVQADVGANEFTRSLAQQTATGNADRALTAGTTNAAAANAQAQDTAHQQLAAASQNVANTQANAQFNAGQQQTASAQNAGNSLTANAQNVNEKAGLGTQAIQAQGNELTATQGLSQAQIAQQTLQQQGAIASQAESDKLLGAGLGGFATAATGLLTASDERVKTGIHSDPDHDVDAFLESLDRAPEAYHYRDPAMGAGEKHGVMAQDLEKSRIGASTVRTAPDGTKMVDTGALTMALAGVLARVAKEARRGRAAT